MLVLTRKPGEEIEIGGVIRIRILSARGARVRLGIAAPRDVSIQRTEIIAHSLEMEEDIARPAATPVAAHARLSHPQR